MFSPIVDVSTWQKDINVSKMLAAGIKAMYIKAGGTDKNNGASYTDWRFRENAQKFSELVPCGYYYFFYPHFDGVKQANYFCNLLNSVKWNLPPAIDIEQNPQNVSQGQFQTQAKKFLDTVEGRLNLKCVIYTRAMFWNASVGSPAWASQYKLWIARYGEELEHPWDNNPNSKLRPRPWTDYWLWQYCADKNGRGEEFGVATSGIDINKVNMSEDKFYTFAKWDKDAHEIVIPVEKEEEKEKEEVVKEETSTVYGAVINYPHKGFLRSGYNALRLRSTPTTSDENNVVGQVGQGYTFMVYKEVQFGDDVWWLVELPNGKVGWGARRIQGITFLEYAE
jgi:GH25 family lysozyme M1 (1,4-beta-N-acetylmuramidase)